MGGGIIQGGMMDAAGILLDKNIKLSEITQNLEITNVYPG